MNDSNSIPQRMLRFAVTGALLAGTPGCPSSDRGGPTVNPAPPLSTPQGPGPSPAASATPVSPEPKPPIISNPGPPEPTPTPIAEPEPEPKRPDDIKTNPGPPPVDGDR